MKKKILIAAFCFLFFGCSYGQVKLDSVRVIMLCADTTSEFVKCGWNKWNYATNTFQCYWQYGYEVYKDTIIIPKGGYFVDNMPSGYNYDPVQKWLVQRLDADKKPLPKSVIIWQTIKL